MKTNDFNRISVKLVKFISGLIFLLLTTLQLSAQPVDPKVTVGGLSEGDISKAAILKVSKLDVTPANITIVSFTMSYPVSDDFVELVSASDKLTTEMISSLNQIKAGTEVSFENIKAKIGDKTVILESVTLKIIE